MIKTGRPRLDDSPGFRERLATILPRLIGKEISQGQAARELDISVRSLKRYAKQDAGDISGSEHRPSSVKPVMFPTELRHHFPMGGIPAWLRKLAFGVDGARAQFLP